MVYVKKIFKKERIKGEEEAQLHASFTLALDEVLFCFRPQPLPTELKTKGAPEPVWMLWRRQQFLVPASNGTTIPLLSSLWSIRDCLLPKMN